jgi:2-haloacid dehalogenase
MTGFDSARIRVLAFDIFGTTVDWYTGVSTQLADLFAANGVDLDPAYLDTLHRESLDDLLAEHGAVLAEDARAAAVRAWHRLPPWPDTVGGLARLRRRHTVAALSNGGFALLTTLAKHAGLGLDCILSAELVRAYKPDAAVYRTAAALLDVPPAEVLMVAAHTWDLAGAAAAGLRTAFVARPAEKGPHGGADTAAATTADLYATDFHDLAAQLGA